MANLSRRESEISSVSRPVVALLATLGTEAFLSNALKGILRTGVTPDQIHIGCPENARASIESVSRQYSDEIRITLLESVASDNPIQSYTRFGSLQFKSISWMKIVFIQQLLREFEHVVYSDLDVVWLSNPIPYLIQVAQVYPLAFQTEGLARFPPAVCAGFASFRRSSRTAAFFEGLVALRDSRSNDGIDDQSACQEMLEADAAWLHDIFMLPEALFPNGLGYRNLQHSTATAPPMAGTISPFLFHANWTIGLENKHQLLLSTGNWLIEDGPHGGQAEGSDDRRAESMNDASSPASLLTVIYPVYDIRSDAIECINRWIGQQNVSPDQYRVIVVAGSEGEPSKQDMRKLLRPQDSLIIASGKGREADYWNAGARAATTSWLLFVEAHAVPESESLKVLTDWIAAHPHAVAVNFRIGNFEDHLMARLMKRWFAEIHSVWLQSSAWPRLHRTAFAVRHDAFRRAGQLEARYGQFAPALLSARMHQQGLDIATLPEATVKHEDSPEMSAHHDDTADYARGEFDARTDNEPAFFEKYFGLSPLHGSALLLPARCARSMIVALLLAARRHPRSALSNLATAIALIPAALVRLRDRSRMFDVLTRADEYAVMHVPLGSRMRWRRFIVAHRRVVRAEQMRWMQRNSRPMSPDSLEEVRPLGALDPTAIVGLHGLEYLNDDPFRWTHPLFVLRLESPRANGTLILETRGLGRQIRRSDLSVAIGHKPLSQEDTDIDTAGYVRLKIPKPAKPGAELSVAIAVQGIVEPRKDGLAGRRLGMPLFSVQFVVTDRGSTRS